jgi:nucleoside-diphosphate-sugar epimerase
MSNCISRQTSAILVKDNMIILTGYNGTPRKVLDVSRISALGWRPTITLPEGIKKTIDWYRDAVQKGEARL